MWLSPLTTPYSITEKGPSNKTQQQRMREIKSCLTMDVDFNKVEGWRSTSAGLKPLVYELWSVLDNKALNAVII